ncbi:MAG: hypothetical protein IK129_07225 [Deltaproteobacteria bacterium]|nr:hypothetical protein [Deltaproteobacteria bacterium]
MITTPRIFRANAASFHPNQEGLEGDRRVGAGLQPPRCRRGKPRGFARK